MLITCELRNSVVFVRVLFGVESGVTSYQTTVNNSKFALTSNF